VLSYYPLRGEDGAARGPALRAPPWPPGAALQAAGELLGVLHEAAALVATGKLLGVLHEATALLTTGKLLSILHQAVLVDLSELRTHAANPL